MEKQDKNQPTPKTEDNLNADAQQFDAMAKAIILNLTWSLAGLTTPKKNTQNQQNPPKV